MGRLEAMEARELMATARVARLATVGEDLAPHLVPVTFAVRADEVVIAIDHKPKTTHNLRRLRNIRANPRVCVLADHYDEDWTRLWWVRADGTAAIVEGADREPALRALAEKYPQYLRRLPTGPVIVISVGRWSCWTSAGKG
jgi:PPOX class probable F420-dependent enzyme